MTHRPIRTEPDGTRVYVGGNRYKPVAKKDRKYAVKKPDDPRAVRWRSEWLLPLELLPDKRRRMPETQPDTDAYHHWWENLLCNCSACTRPQAEVYRKRARHDALHGRRAKSPLGLRS